MSINDIDWKYKYEAEADHYEQNDDDYWDSRFWHGLFYFFKAAIARGALDLVCYIHCYEITSILIVYRLEGFY